jgi:hypothetical protein
MKRSKVIVLIMVLASMTGCLVSSLHPYYKKEDKQFDSVMVGNWIDGDSCIWIIQPHMTGSFMGPQKQDSSYTVTYCEEEGKYAIMTGTLFRLNGIGYVDFVPDPDEDHCTSDMTCFHHIPVHTLARVQYNRDSIMLYWYGEDWLNDLFEQNRIRIKHETVKNGNYERHVLTASTDELQKFIRKYANDPKTAEDIEETFARGDTRGQDGYGLFLKLKPYQGELPESAARQVQPG